MEGLVGVTNTGRADIMANYYRHRERQVYDAIYQAITMNLQNFAARLKVAEPLFYIEAMLNSQDIVLSPAANDIQKLFLQTLRGYIADTSVG